MLFDAFIARIRAEYSHRVPQRSELQRLGNALKAICVKGNFDASTYPLALPGEALMHKLNVDPRGGPSLYLVSDGLGVDTVPHEHQTWAVIIGIKGAEFNIFYKAEGDEHRNASRVGDHLVGEGDVLVMEAHEIHAIDSRRGIHPTCHVHLYGRSLASLPNFASRCFTEGKQTH